MYDYVSYAKNINLVYPRIGLMKVFYFLIIFYIYATVQRKRNKLSIVKTLF